MSKLYKGISTLVVFIVLNVIIFVVAEDMEGAFWPSYIFFFIAFLIFAFIAVYLSETTKKRILGYPLIIGAGVYVAVETFLALIFMLAAYELVVPAILIQLVVLAVFALLLFTDEFVSKEIHKKEQVRGTDLMNFRFILEKMKLVQQRVEYSAPYRKTIEQAYDSLAGGQVTSTPEVKDLESSILTKIDQLSGAVDRREADVIQSICSEIINLSRDREMRLKLRQPF